jgi:hypothetical protein
MVTGKVVYFNQPDSGLRDKLAFGSIRRSSVGQVMGQPGSGVLRAYS